MNQSKNLLKAILVLIFLLAGTSLFASNIIVMPDSVTLEPEHGIHFKAQLFDDDGQVRQIALDKYKWTVLPNTLGEISEDGYFIAGKRSGRGKVFASLVVDGAVYTGEADVWVGKQVHPPIKLVIIPSRKIVTPGDSLQYNAYAVSPSGRRIKIEHLRWMVHPQKLGKIDNRGMFYAGSTIMQGKVYAIAEIAGQKYKDEARLIIA